MASINLFVRYSALPLFAPLVGQPAQLLFGQVNGASGSQIVTVRVTRPDGTQRNYVVPSDYSGAFRLDAAGAADQYFGVSQRGTWLAQASCCAGPAVSNPVVWSVAWFIPHGIP